jgi:molecular chaperone DnaK
MNTKKSLPIDLPPDDISHQKSQQSGIDRHPLNFESNPPIGIDLGTSNSVIAKWVNTIRMTGSSVYKLNDQDSFLMPSVVHYDKDDDDAKGEFIVGKLAKSRQVMSPETVVTHVKRKISNGSKCIQLGNDYFSPSEISSEIIKAMFKSVISTGLSCPEGIVVSVPYYFTQLQNNNTRLAIEKAIQETPHFNNTIFLGLIPEPVAATLSFAMDHINETKEQFILTFDLGGGTLDVTILRLNITGSSIDFEVLAVDGDDKFGGLDFDYLIESHIIDHESISFDGISHRQEKIYRNKIREAAQDAKEQLSRSKKHEIYIADIHQPTSLSIKRSLFEKMLCGKNFLNRNFSDELIQILERVELKAKITSKNIDLILPVGGSAKIPFFQKMLKSRYSNAMFQNINEDGSDPMFQSVAKGASIYAAYLLDSQKGYKILPKDIDIQIIQRTCHHLGIRTRQHNFNVIIPENSIVPDSRDKFFYPVGYRDSDKKIAYTSVIEVYQGKSSDIYENTLIGKINLPDIYAHGRPLNEIRIQITFDVETTVLKVNIIIPKSSANKTDIDITEHIQLEKR